jgi:hypothetical protein
MNDHNGERRTERRPIVRELAERFAIQLVGVTLIITLIVVIAALTR